MKCGRCGSENVSIQYVQTGSKTKSKDKYYVRHHGLLWWLLIGWWWWIVVVIWDLFLAFFTFGISLFFKKKKHVADRTGTSTTTIQSKSVAICQSCGKTWDC